jgi:hypothetical protein
MSRPRKTLVAALTVAALTLAGGAIAYGAGVFAGDGGAITACANNDNGSLRALDPQSSKPSLQACRDNETTLTWGPGGAGGGGGISGYEVVTAQSSDLGADYLASATATCSAGKKPISGGMKYDLTAVPPGYHWTLVQSYPEDTGWTVVASEDFAPGYHFTTYAVCADA